MPDFDREFTFISYAHEDLDQVRKLYEGLKERKVNAWFDKEDLVPGKWEPQIEKAISRSKYFVICLSNAAIKKTSGEKPGFQAEELQTAWEFAREQDEKNFKIIPVRLEACGLSKRLLRWHNYDLYEDWEGVLDKLALHLGGNSLADAAAIDERTEDVKILEGIMGRAATFYFAGDYEKALSFIESAINIKPDLHKAWYNKGLTFAALDRNDEALGAYAKAIEFKPVYSKAWSNKGAALHALGRYNEALEAFNKAIEFKPDLHEAWSNKGAALHALDRYDEALEAYNKAIEFKPDYSKAWYNLACLYSLKKEKSKALKYLRNAIEYGYSNLAHIKKDTDLDYIRNEEEFIDLVRCAHNGNDGGTVENGH